MSDRMTPMKFPQLIKWIMEEKASQNTVFGEHRAYRTASASDRMIFNRKLETPVGPAAGPHTQLTQNIVAAYYTGSRFFELKTVQKIDGDDLPVSKPCIKADDEGYNVEWSTELYVPQALEEYIKAWFILNVISKEFSLGAMDGFQFNMSVGYDLEGIKTPKIDNFIESLKDASGTAVFKECRQYLLDNISMFKNFTAEDVRHISPYICNSATLSTLHGCPSDEIERIAAYLIDEKGLNTFIKCNPTLLGYEFARKTMDAMGYDYVAFGDFHFKDDLQYEDAVPMLKRLMALADEKHLEFGVKITNTFPVDIKQNELPGNEMYMSGKALYPLSISLAAKLSKEFDGKLRISYSGGADNFNIKGIVDAGIWPVTVATTLLKPGGYERFVQIAELLEKVKSKWQGVDVSAVTKLAESAVTDRLHIKAVKPIPDRKIKKSVPLTDCFMAPCKEGCPIHQDITAYMKLAEEKKYFEALKIITEKNPLPFITGTICAHNCMSACTRNFYEEPVDIRTMKLISAHNGYAELIKTMKPDAAVHDEKIAVIGGGPAGLSAAFFLTRAGYKVTVFEAGESLGGVVRRVIPEFRIDTASIEKDIELVTSMGAEVRLNTRVDDIELLKKDGYKKIIVATGASNPGMLKLEGKDSINALEFLTRFKAEKGGTDIGKNIVVIGGGNTAMDTARAAKRTKSAEHVYLVYRRTRRYMPADAEELMMALEDGVEFRELLSPVSFSGTELLCNVMELSDMDSSGRRSVKETSKTVCIEADTVIAAVGEHVPTKWLESNGISVDEKGRAVCDAATLESSLEGVYIIGDGLMGPATVVEGIRDAKLASDAIIGKSTVSDVKAEKPTPELYNMRGNLEFTRPGEKEGGRCLNCAAVCENCVSVCPNRANISITVPGMDMHQIIHVDHMCNECGNCKSFCPYDSAPYKDKFTLFINEDNFNDSENQGFLVTDMGSMACKVRLDKKVYDICASQSSSNIPETLLNIIRAVCKDYKYLFDI